MLSWQDFFESRKEKEEERTGMDYDNDNEKGESSEHKAKVKKAKEKTLDFFEKRKSGAAEIASRSQAKGGPSMLSFWHFKAKNRPYEEVIQAIKSNSPESFFLSKYKSLLSKLNHTKMKQEDFQKTIGQLEVFGEALFELFGK